MVDKPKRIILSGGGTMGSVSPLLAIAQKYQAEYLFVGTKKGPERSVVTELGMNFKAISSGKLRRYLSVHNFLDLFRIEAGFWQSVKIIREFKPDVVLTAGSFASVPMAIAAWFNSIPVIVHQQDIQQGLANKFMTTFAKAVTVCFPVQAKDFPSRKVVVTGNPVRQPEQTNNAPKARLIITGGGLGARSMNTFMSQFIPELLKKYEVHHILGSENWDQKYNGDGYFAHKFIKAGMMDFLASADIVISRAGMSITSEVASLKKALILIPMPHSHQEKNASFFAKNNAALVVKQGSKHIMNRYLSKLMTSDKLVEELGNNLYNLFPKNTVKNYCKLIDSIIK